MELDHVAIRKVVAAALDEDLGNTGDITTAAVLPPGIRCLGRILARHSLVLAGLPLAHAVFDGVAGRGEAPVLLEEEAHEGERLESGRTALTLRGEAASILAGERTLLNFLQRLSGIATLTRACVEEVTGTGVVLLDTRKTTPGLRGLEKYAVSVGGGTNHRRGLYDRVLIKDNHLALTGSAGRAVREALNAGYPPDRVEVEADTLEQVEEAAAAGAGWILLDNFSPEGLRAAVAICRGRARLEASGGLRPGNLRRFAETGVHALSLGALTHSAPAADLSLEVSPTEGA